MTTTGEANLQDFRPKPGSNPLQWVFDLFSSVWLGIWLLVFLFVYSSVGSAGMWVPGALGAAQHADWVHELSLGWLGMWTQVHIRQAPGLEMTEFEWFHWWPFNLNIALICINLAVATVRRIPFNVLNLGVWMIHGGIIILAIGSVYYFSTKLEGDAPILRRQIVVNVPGSEPVSFPAQPGARKEIESANGNYILQVMNIDPQWEIRSGDDAGQTAYAISVAVQSPEHQFVRQLLANYPQYTEDTIWTGDERQPMVRAMNALGRPIVDDSIDLSLDYHAQEYFYLMDSTSLYIREKGERDWVQRPIRNLPRYNDYLVSEEDVWPTMDGPSPRISPLELEVPAHEPSDPLGETPVYVTRYLRYASIETRRTPGGREIDPVVVVQLRAQTGATEQHQLVAFDPESNLVAGGRLHFTWVDSEDQFDVLTDERPPQVTLRVPEHDVEITVDARPMLSEDEPFTPIGHTPYSYRIQSLERLEEAMVPGVDHPVSLAVVQFRTPERTFQRWVFDTDRIPNRDLPIGGAAMHGDELKRDERIEASYTPAAQRAPVTIVAGPNETDLHLVLALPGRDVRVQPLEIGSSATIQQGISLNVLRYAARTTSERRPMIVPPRERERQDRQQRSLARVHLPVGEGRSAWLPYHLYPFKDRNETFRRFPYRPTEVELPDGRVLELIFSRERRPLPARVALHDFVLETHIGGFTGQTTSIRDWASVVRFETMNGWTETKRISMNKPAEFGGFSYFQSQWDPPDEPRFEGDVRSQGLNFTVLGVGNRNGVWTQLFGCCVAVIGMMYSFYLKPLIKRRRQERVYEQLQRAKASVGTAAGASSPDALPTNAVANDQPGQKKEPAFTAGDRDLERPS